MRRAITLILALLVLAAAASGDDVRIQIGLNGYFPAGGWANCRITGLGSARTVDVIIDEQFERTLEVKDGVAEGQVLFPDEMPLIRLDVPGRQVVSLRIEDLAKLHGVKDKLPVLFIGDNAPTPAQVQKVLGVGPIEPIVISSNQFAALGINDYDWVNVFAIGNVSRPPSKLKDDLNGVIVGDKRALVDWPTNFQWEDVDSLRVHNRALAQVLPVPRGLVHPEMYEIFGPVKWPWTARRNAVFIMLGILAAVAVTLAIPIPAPRSRMIPMVLLAAVISILVSMVGPEVLGLGQTEAVSLYEPGNVNAGGRLAYFEGKANLTRKEQDLSVKIRYPDFQDRKVIPIVRDGSQWVQNNLKMDLGGEEVTWRAPGFSRMVAVCYSDYPSEYRKLPAYYPPADWLNIHHPNARVDEIRQGMLRYWLNLHRKGDFLIGWTEAKFYTKRLFAGTMFVERQESAPAP